MGLGFLVRRRPPATISRSPSLTVGTITALFSSLGSSVPPSLPLPYSLLPRTLAGGPRILTLARHLVSSAAAERVHADVETHHGGCGTSGPQSGVRRAPQGRTPDGFHGGAPAGSLPNGDGFRCGKEGHWIDLEASLRGSRDAVREDDGGYRRGSPPDRGYYGRGLSEQNFGFDGGNPGGASGDAYVGGGKWSSEGFQKGTTQGLSFGDPQSSQHNLSGYGGGNPREAYPGNPNASYLGKCNDSEWNTEYPGGKQSDQSTYGFPGSPSGEIHDSMSGNHDAGPVDEPTEVADGNPLKGTVDELDRFLQEGKAKEAVEVLRLLEKQGMVLDLLRYLKLMDKCGDAKALEEARFVHNHILRSMGNPEVKIHNRILAMYCKCGSMDDAYQWFDKMSERNFTSWDTMIMGLADNGLGEDAIDLFNSFLQMGLRPDGRMFIAVFHACSVLGAVDEGMLHFESMSKEFAIIPTMEHYVSIVDMLGQTGYLDEAVEFVEMIPIEPSVDVWESLMNRCRLQGNVELGDRCAEIVGILDPSRLTKQSKDGLLPINALDLAKEKEKKKANILEVRSRVHEYRAGDTSHPEKDRIYALIKGLAATLRESGYVPDTRFVLHDIDQESKEEALLAHSERLATAYGLISSAVRSPIRIIKNLRICGDCHSYMKIVSKLVGRELIIRDAKRFHHFKGGLCSCNDYW